MSNSSEVNKDRTLAPREPESDDDKRQRIILPRGRLYHLAGRGKTFARVVEAQPGSPTVLLLHGWTATADLNWYSSYDVLDDRYGLVALDHRGHGRGIRSKKKFSLEDCADDAAALLDQLGIDQVIVCGYSMGGPIAQLLWRRHPQRVLGLVLCATAATFSSSKAEQIRFAAIGALAHAIRLVPAALRKIAAEQMLTSKSGKDLRQWARGELRRHDPLKLVQAGRSIGTFDSRHWISSIDVPVSLVVTTRDDVVNIDRQLALAKAIPGSTVHSVDGTHTACVGRANQFRQALLAAIKDVDEKSR